MSTRVSSRRPSKRRITDVNNSGKRVLNVDTMDVPHGSIRVPGAQVMASSAFPPINQPVGQQATRSNLLIDLEAIEDDVQMLSSPGGFPQHRNQSRRSRPVTIDLDEDSDVQTGSSGATVEETTVPATANNRNRRRFPPWRATVEEPSVSATANNHNGWGFPSCSTIINCETNEYVDFDHKSKKRCATNIAEPSVEAPKEPIFTCSICWGQLVEETSTVCGHIFCQGCIKSAIKAQKRCPTCRKSLTMRNIHRVYFPSMN